MYLGVHYLPDVLSGIAVGGVIGATSGMLFKSINTAMVNSNTPGKFYIYNKYIFNIFID